MSEKTKQTDIYKKLRDMAKEETSRSIEIHGKFNSPHEAYAVLLEEFEEAMDEIEIIKQEMPLFWDCVKKNEWLHTELHAIENHALEAAAELIQVAAMAKKSRLHITGVQL